MSSDGPSRGRRTFDSTASGAAKLLSDRLGDGHCYAPASCDARAVLRTDCALLTRYAVNGAHEAIRVDVVLFAITTSLRGLPIARGSIRVIDP